MGLIDKLLQLTRIIGKKPDAIPMNEFCLQLLELENFMNQLYKEDRYVARSEYWDRIRNYQPAADYFQVLSNSGMLRAFCVQHGMAALDVENCLKHYTQIEEMMDQHNENFINLTLNREKEYLDHILKEVDPDILLDEDQRRVVLADEDYCLVIAGAGAGKTTTVAAKVRYLVERRSINPSQILVVSFTNKAVNELKEKINDELGIACPIATFHATGNAVIHKNSPEEKLNIVDGSKLYFVIRDYLFMLSSFD